jgi:hypothetical protein
MAKDSGRVRPYGGPGSSHQDATKPKPEADERHGPEPRQRRTADRSRVSGGGGERDKHHTHDPRMKS